MTLNLKDDNDPTPVERDVRETAITGNFTSFPVENTANQDLAAAAGWTDLTSITKTFTLKETNNVIIMASVRAILGDDVQAAGAEIRIDIDGSTATNSERAVIINLEDSVPNAVNTNGANTIVTLYTQHMEPLAPGSHTVKVQGRGLVDGTTFAVRFTNKNMGVIIVP